MFPKPTYKTGGTNLRKSKPSKNDRAMVSGVSSILRKIKDKKNRKEVAGDMVNQFNREGVNYNKEKFLKNSRSFQAGGPVKPIYTSNFYDPRLWRYEDSLMRYTLNPGPVEASLSSADYEIIKRNPDEFTSKNMPIGKKNVRTKTVNGITTTEADLVYKKPVQPIIYKPELKNSRYVKRIEPKEENTTPINTPTPIVQTPKQLPASTSQMQTYNYMSTEDKKRAVKKYGDPSKVPFQGVDINQLRKEVPTFQVGGTRQPIYVSDPNDPRLARYNDSVALYLKNNMHTISPGFNLTRTRIPLNDPELTHWGYRPRSSDVYLDMRRADDYAGYSTRIKPSYLNRYSDFAGNKIFIDIYKKPTQPIKFAHPKIVERQKLLKDAGLYTGELDGIWGSGSEKAWKEYTERKKATSSTTPSTSSTSRTTSTTPRFSIKGIIADQYVPDSKNPNSRDYRYRVETDKGFDVIQGKKAFDEWKEKNASEYQPYYKKSTNAPIDYNKGRVNEYLEKPTLSYKKGGQHGGLDRWFAEKWVDVKSGKPCGRQEGENRAYPACRPSKRISSKTPKTSSELSSQEKARFKATKTSSQRIPYNHKRK